MFRGPRIGTSIAGHIRFSGEPELVDVSLPQPLRDFTSFKWLPLMRDFIGCYRHLAALLAVLVTVLDADITSSGCFKPLLPPPAARIEPADLLSLFLGAFARLAIGAGSRRILGFVFRDCLISDKIGCLN